MRSPDEAERPPKSGWGESGREASRLQVLASLKVLDTPADPRFDRITELARSLFAVPTALVSLVDRDRQWFRSAAGLDMPETPLSDSFCAHAIRAPGADAVLVVEDATADPRFRHSRLVTGPPFVRFYAGAPLVIDGEKVGSLCLMAPEPRGLSPEQATQLRQLAATTSELLRLARMDVERDLLMRELNHRIKNVLSVTMSVAELSARSHPEASVFMEGFRSRLQALSTASDGLIERRWQGADAAATAAAVLAQAGLDDETTMAVDIPAFTVASNATHTFAVIVHELATNALKYGALSRAGGHVALSGAVEDGVLLLTWEERGGPPVVALPATTGFGLTMIGLSSFRTGRKATLDWRRQGLLCRFAVPGDVEA